MKTKFVFLLCLILLLLYNTNIAQNLNWARMTQGIQADNTVGLTVDNVLNIYAVSNFSGNISITTGQNFSSFGKEDFLVKKFSPNGVLQWARKFGGPQSDFANNISCDDNNNVYVTGTFQDTLRLFDQLLLTSGVIGANVGFILKLDPLGNILWAKALQTNQLSFPVKALVNATGQVVVCGYFDGNTDFDPGPGQNVISSGGLFDIFFLQLTSEGNFVWVKKIGGTESESILDFELDEEGNIISTGQFNQIVDFDPGTTEFFTTHNGGTDIFVHKLSGDGSFLWAKTMGGGGFDTGFGIDISTNDDIVIVGRFSNLVDFNPAVNQNNTLISDGSWDGFVIRFDSLGNFIWVKRIGGTQQDQCQAVDISPNDNIVVGGTYRSTVNFNPNLFPNQFSTSNGGADVFQLVLNEDGSYNSHFSFGGLGNDQINKIKSYSINNQISAGNFNGIVDFDPSQNTSNFTSLGNTDGFLVNVFNCVKPFIPVLQSTATSICPRETFTLTLPGAKLNGANQWSWYQNSCNTTSFANGNSITGTAVQSNSFYVRGTGGCVSNADCKSILINVFTDTLRNQSFNICEGDSVIVGNNIYSSSGLYIDTLVASVGCDSVVFTNLVVIPSTEREQSFTICPGEEIIVGSNIYRNNGTYRDTLLSFNGCDSIVTTQINVLPIEIITQNIDVCFGENFIVEDSVYTETGTYINSITTADGCENFIVTNLTVHPLEYNITHNLCFGDTLRIGNQFYTTSLIVVEFLGSSVGCDSIVNHTINFFNVSFENRELYLCEGDSVVVGENIYFESGLYIDSLLNIAGCDSIIQSNIVFFDKPDPIELFFNICEGQSILVNGETYFAPGIYIDSIQTVTGCDSIITINLNVFPNFTQRFVTICEGDSIKFGTRQLKTQGVYSEKFTSSLGCDSTSTIVLTVINKIFEFAQYQICEGESVSIGNSVYSSEGSYTDTLVSSRGCDSIIHSEIIVRPKFYEQTFKICSGEFITVGTNLYTSTGIYIDTLQSELGCDSILTTRVTVNPVNFISQSFTICSGQSIVVGNSVYSISGTYNTVLQNQFGCDSTIETQLTVLPPGNKEIFKTLCKGEVFTIGNFSFSNEGIFEVFVSGPDICDTLFKINIDVVDINASINRTGNELSVLFASGSEYQWYKCDLDTVKINGATGSSFAPSENGNYLVVIRSGQCTFFSSCYSFVRSSVWDQLPFKMAIHPNPVTDILSIDMMDGSAIHAEIKNTFNASIQKFIINNGKTEINVSSLPSGMYFVSFVHEQKSFVISFIKI
jgi:hypothetical protein